VKRQALLQCKGAAQGLPHFLRKQGLVRLLLVTGKQSWEQSGAASLLVPLLEGLEVIHFNNFSANPSLDDVVAGLKVLGGKDVEGVLAVGGGSALDMGKLLAFFSRVPLAPGDWLGGQRCLVPRLPWIAAVPTTAGSGSEATHFAVCYRGHEKFSVADPGLLPDLTILEPGLLLSMPQRLAATSGMDALCQAIESMWSVNSTEESMGYALESISLAHPNLVSAAREGSASSLEAMGRAAHLAGKAINLSKTTACHALSYPMTTHFGVTHGHAVSLTLPEFLAYNSLVGGEDCQDSRGSGHVQDAIKGIVKALGQTSVEGACQFIRTLMVDIGLTVTLGSVGIRRELHIKAIVENVNTERMVNNPRIIDKRGLQELLLAIA
jgi:alcohol dehydrogenase class IV